MKLLKRMRLINWHYFLDETLEFGSETLIAGRNSAGKSTIIDALQVLLVANQRQIRFNSAAHEEAKRTLLAYLRGKTGSDNRPYLREGDFTTHLAAEFYDQEKKESFIIGAVFDVYRDDTVEDEYYILSGISLAEIDFLAEQSGRWKNRLDFHRYLGDLPGRHITERNKASYQKALLHRMGQIHDRFFQVFVKALSFKPLNSVRDFVYQYILDPKELQLDLLRQNFEIHERYQRELAALEERRAELERICACYERYARLRELVEIQEYVIRGLRLRALEEDREELAGRIVALREQAERLAREIDLVTTEQDAASRRAEEAWGRWQSHEIERRRRELERELADLDGRLAKARKEWAAFTAQLREEGAFLSELARIPPEAEWPWGIGEAERLAHAGTRLAEMAAREPSASLGEEAEDELREIGVLLGDLYDRAVKVLGRLEDQRERLRLEEERLAAEIRGLEEKRRPYRPEMVNLRNLLSERLAGRSPVWVFCEEVEVRDEEWRDALEGYLHTQRFDLLVRPECFAEALAVYEREKRRHQIEGVGLVDTEQEARYLGTAQPGSLAEELISPNPIIQARIAHILGRVMKARDEQDLRRYRSAITKTCMSFHNLVARQIPRDRYAVPYLGSAAITRQLEIKRAELDRTREERQVIDERVARLTNIVRGLGEKRSLHPGLLERLALPGSITTLEDERHRVAEEYARLDLGEVERLRAEYEHWKARSQELVETLRRLGAEETLCRDELRRRETEEVLLADRVREAQAAWHEGEAALSAGQLARAQERWREANLPDLPWATKIANWENSQKGNITRRDQEFTTLRDLRHAYNLRYSYNADAGALENTAYQSVLEELASVDIPKYQEKLAEARSQSEEEFKSHFLFKLREAIEQARSDFHELNYALNHFPFHEDRYRFEVKPREKYRRFYDAIMASELFAEGSLFGLPADEKTAILHEIFERLIKGEAGEIEEFTDYRNYLDFDLVVTGEGGRYSFGDVHREKSGGETQTPFYIAILASFNHLYSDKTMRLVVFDEAFNKMDEERIKTSLRLVKRLRLQLVAAVPDEKMQHMAGEVSTTLIVHREGFRCFVDFVDRGALEAAAAGGGFGE